MSKSYKIRKLTTNNETGDAYGVTIPQDYATYFSGTKFEILTGSVVVFQQKCFIADMINENFKQLTLQIPAENYPLLKMHQIKLREQILSQVELLNNSIILVSGCK